MRVILLGSPGAGKGTQAKVIAKRYNIPAISTGDIFRAAIQQKTPLGVKVQRIVESGQLVPDDLVIELVKERLSQSDCSVGFLLDGFPRTVNQAVELSHFTPIDIVIDIEVSHDEIVKRLSGRRVHLGSGRTYHIESQPPKVAGKDDVTGEPLVQRPDDQPATVLNRLSLYESQTRPVREYYENGMSKSSANHTQYVQLNGFQPIDKITNDLMTILNKIEDKT